MATEHLGLPTDTLGDSRFKRSFKTLAALLDAAIGGNLLAGSKTYDAPDTADGAAWTTTVTVTGAALGDFVEGISLDVDAAGLTITGYVSAADTVTVRGQNKSGGAVNLGSATLRVRVRKAA